MGPPEATLGTPGLPARQAHEGIPRGSRDLPRQLDDVAATTAEMMANAMAATAPFNRTFW